MSFASATNIPIFPPPNTAGALVNDGEGNLSFQTGLPSSTAIDIVGGSANSIVYQSAPTNTAFITNGGEGKILTSHTSGPPTWEGQVAFANDLTGGSAGQVVYQAGNNNTAFTNVGIAGQVLFSNGAAPPTWQTNASSTANALAGGSAGQVVYQAGNNNSAFTSVGGAGQVLVSNGTSAPSWLSLQNQGSASSVVSNGIRVDTSGPQNIFAGQYVDFGTPTGLNQIIAIYPVTGAAAGGASTSCEFSYDPARNVIVAHIISGSNSGTFYFVIVSIR